MGRASDINQSTEWLQSRLAHLTEHEAQPYLSLERKAQLSREIGYVAFELEMRGES